MSAICVECTIILKWFKVQRTNYNKWHLFGGVDNSKSTKWKERCSHQVENNYKILKNSGVSGVYWSEHMLLTESWGSLDMVYYSSESGMCSVSDSPKDHPKGLRIMALLFQKSVINWQIKKLNMVMFYE